MSEVTVALGGNLPSGDGNGLVNMGSELTKDMASRKRVRAAIVLFDVQKMVEKTDDGSKQAVLRLRRIEVVQNGEDFTVMQRVLMREFERRTGQTTLPFELEEEVQAALDGLDFSSMVEEEQITLFDPNDVLPAEIMDADIPDADALHCPTCDSPNPRTHPATGEDGEVYQVCKDAFHTYPLGGFPAAVDGPYGNTQDPEGTTRIEHDGVTMLSFTTSGGVVMVAPLGSPPYEDTPEREGVWVPLGKLDNAPNLFKSAPLALPLAEDKDDAEADKIWADAWENRVKGSLDDDNS